MTILRDYQEQLIVNARISLATHRHILVQSMTGSGKTKTFARMVSMSAKKGKRILIVSHRIEIIQQNAAACREEGVDVATITPRSRKIPKEKVASGMAQTLLQRVKKPEWVEYVKSIDMLIIDEAHDSSCNFLFSVITPECYVIGFSATPVRYGNQRQLGLDYDDIVTGPSAQYLIDRKYLCRCRLFSLDAPKMDDVDYDYGRGDYSLKSMSRKFETKPRYVGTVNNWERIAKGTKTIVFCCSSEQAIEITKEFCNRGYKAKYSLSGSFDDDDEYSDERKEIIRAFAANEFDILVNVGQMVAGIDVPDIKTCVLCYSTMSLTKYLQSIGRASRPHPSKNGEFLCLDMGANFERLGRYEDDRQWYLWHNTSKGGGPAPTKICSGCNRLVPVQAKDCPFCGYHFQSKQEIYEVELQEILAARKDGGKETNREYVARKKLEGWSNTRILASVCKKNPKNAKEVFMDVIQILRTGHGEKINPQYWHFFKQNILNKRKATE